MTTTINSDRVRHKRPTMKILNFYFYTKQCVITVSRSISFRLWDGRYFNPLIDTFNKQNESKNRFLTWIYTSVGYGFTYYNQYLLKSKPFSPQLPPISPTQESQILSSTLTVTLSHTGRFPSNTIKICILTSGDISTQVTGGVPIQVIKTKENCRKTTL